MGDDMREIGNDREKEQSIVWKIWERIWERI